MGFKSFNFGGPKKPVEQSEDQKYKDTSNKLQKLQGQYFQLVGKRDSAQQRHDAEQKRKQECEAESEILLYTNILLKKVAQYQRQQACQQIEELATHALQQIFGPNMSLQISIKESNRSRPEADIFVIRENNGRVTIGAPEDSYGGGVVDVISAALRLVIMQILEPEISGPIFLDEPTKHISAQLVGPFHDFLKSMSEKFDRQIILITHQNVTNADNHIRISQNEEGFSCLVPVHERRSVYE